MCCALQRQRALVEATNALLPYSLSPQEIGHLLDVQRRASVIAELLVRGLRSHRDSALFLGSHPKDSKQLFRLDSRPCWTRTR
jgi:hypothetical protein